MRSAASAIESLTASDRRSSIERIRDAGKTVVQGLSSLRTHLGGGNGAEDGVAAVTGTGVGGTAIGSTIISDENAQVPDENVSQVPNTAGTSSGRRRVLDDDTAMNNMDNVRIVGGVASASGGDVATKLAVSLATERELRATVRQLRSERDAHKRSAERAHAALATARASDEELVELVRLRSENERLEADKARLRTDSVSLQRALERARAQKRESDELASQERRARSALERVCSKLRARVAAAEDEAKRGAMLDDALRERDAARAAAGAAKARADELAARVAEADALQAKLDAERRRADAAELAAANARQESRARSSRRSRERDRDERISTRLRRRDTRSARHGRREGFHDLESGRSGVNVQQESVAAGETGTRRHSQLTYEDESGSGTSRSRTESALNGRASRSRSRSRSSTTSLTRTSETEMGRDTSEVRTTPMVRALEKLTQALDEQFRESDAYKESVEQRLRTQHGDTFT